MKKLLLIATAVSLSLTPATFANNPVQTEVDYVNLAAKTAGSVAVVQGFKGLQHIPGAGQRNRVTYYNASVTVALYQFLVDMAQVASGSRSYSGTPTAHFLEGVTTTFVFAAIGGWRAGGKILRALSPFSAAVSDVAKGAKQLSEDALSAAASVAKSIADGAKAGNDNADYERLLADQDKSK